MSRGIPVPAALGGVVLAFAVGLVCNGLRDTAPSSHGIERPSPAPSATKPIAKLAPALDVPRLVRPAATKAEEPAPETRPARPATSVTSAEPIAVPAYNPPSLGSGRHGEGEVIAFYEPLKSPEERARWENARRKRWESRLVRENEVAVELMKEKLGIDESQAAAVKKILGDRLAARLALIDGLNSGTLLRVDMEDHVLAIKNKALAGLKATLTPAQYEGYFQLDPRQRVLDEEAHTPK